MNNRSQNDMHLIPWKGVAAILAAGFLVSAGMLLNARSAPEQTPATPQERPMYTLTFLDEQGDGILQEQQVQEGGYAIPPALESENDGIAFRCWSQKLYDIRRSTELQPSYQDLRWEQNAFYIDSQCVQLGEEVTADLWLSGNVRLSSILLTVEYDPEVLLELECDTAQGPFRLVSAEPGVVTLQLDESQNLTAPTTAASFRFRTNPGSDDLASTRLRISMNDPAVITEGGEVGTNCCAVHGDIYLLS